MYALRCSGGQFPDLVKDLHPSCAPFHELKCEQLSVAGRVRVISRRQIQHVANARADKSVLYPETMCCLGEEKTQSDKASAVHMLDLV